MKTTTERRVPEILADQGTGHYTFEVDEESKRRIWDALGGRGAQPRAEVCPGIVPTRGSGEAAHDAAISEAGPAEYDPLKKYRKRAGALLIAALELGTPAGNHRARVIVARIRKVVERRGHR